MVDAGASTGSKRATPRPAVAGLLVVLALGVFLAAFYFLDGASLVSDLLGRDPVAFVTEWLAGGKTTPKRKDDGRRPGSSAAARPDEPSRDRLEVPQGIGRDDVLRMYSEQIESGRQLADLVAGRFTRFDLREIASEDDRAIVYVTAHYRDGKRLNGSLRFRRSAETWFFTSIHRAGITEDRYRVTDRRMLDYGVANTIVREQVRRQDVIVALLDGQWDRMDVLGVRRGRDTATLTCRLTGKDAPDQTIEVVCIRKVLADGEYWFLTACRKV